MHGVKSQLKSSDTTTDSSGAAASSQEVLDVVVESILSSDCIRFTEISGAQRRGVACIGPEVGVLDATDFAPGEELLLEGEMTGTTLNVTVLHRLSRLLEGRIQHKENSRVWTRSGEIVFDNYSAPRSFVSRDSGRVYEALPLDQLRTGDPVMILARREHEFDRFVAVAVGVHRTEEHEGARR